MIRTLNEVLAEREKVINSIKALETERNRLRSEIDRKKEVGENSLNEWKHINSIMISLTRLQGIKQALDYMVNYDSFLDTRASYINEKTLYTL